MAEFTKGVQGVNPSPYIGLSQVSPTPKSDDSMGKLFKGLGTMLDAGVSFLDERNKSNIDNELTKGIDAIRGAQGVDAAVEDAQATQLIPDTSNTPSGGGAATPPIIDSSVARITKLHEAYKAGKIGDTTYYAQVDALSRQVRAKYPGYRDEIDKKVSSVIGTNPANALRKSLLQDLEQANQKKASAEETFFKDVKTNFEHLSPQTRKAVLEGRRDSTFQAEVYNEIANSQSNDANTKREKAQLELDASRGTALSGDAEAKAISETNQYVMKTVNSGVSAAIGSKIGELARTASEGKALKPEDIALVRGQFAQLKANIKTGVLDILQRPLREGSTHSYSSIIKNSGTLNGITEQSLARIEVMEQQLINGEFGAFAANANALKASENAETRKILESNDFFRTFNSVKEIVGKDVMAVWLGRGEGMKTLDAMSTAVNQLFVAKGLKGEGFADEHLKAMVSNAPKGKDGKPRMDPAQTRDYLDTNARLLGSDKVEGDILKKLVSTMYGKTSDSFINLFQESQRANVFAKLSSPEITKNMVKNKESDPQSWKSYSEWMRNNFYAINVQGMNDIKSMATADLGVTVAVDEGGKLRIVDYRPSGYRPDVTPGELMVRGPRVQALQNRVNQFNMGLDSLEPVFKAEGLKTKEALSKVYKDMGLDAGEDKESGNADSPKSNKQSSLGNQIQLASFTSEDNTVPGMRDRDLLSLEDRDPELSLEDGPQARELAQASGTFKPVLDVIGRAEAPRGYNQIFGRGREAPLEEMTISDVYQLQRRMLAGGSESTAVGRYQFLKDTLRETVTAMGLDPETTKFTRDIQDQLAVGLVSKHLRAYQAGRIDKDTLADRLADKWAGLPLASGQSRYKGVGSNNATVSRQAVLDAIDELTQQ